MAVNVSDCVQSTAVVTASNGLGLRGHQHDKKNNNSYVYSMYVYLFKMKTLQSTVCTVQLFLNLDGYGLRI